MCKILSRIKILADTEGIAISAIERTIGASRGVISKAIAKGTDIQSKWLELICEKYPKYSPLWLVTGQGSMFRDDFEMTFERPSSVTETVYGKNIAEEMRQFSQSTPVVDEAFIPHVSNKKSQDRPFEHLVNPEKEPKMLPLVSVKAVGGFAGKDFSIKEQDIESYYVIPKFRNLDVDFLIEVIGDSMMPRLFPGDIIACSVIRNPNFIQWNKTYLIATDEQGMIVKRLKKSLEKNCFLAVSDNVDYDPFDIPVSDIKGLARVVGVIHAD